MTWEAGGQDGAGVTGQKKFTKLFNWDTKSYLRKFKITAFLKQTDDRISTNLY